MNRTQTLLMACKRTYCISEMLQTFVYPHDLLGRAALAQMTLAGA
ncbi:MAG: hypothetical protein ABL891_17975 [Burkholderiales bacterium]